MIVDSDILYENGDYFYTGLEINAPYSGRPFRSSSGDSMKVFGKRKEGQAEASAAYVLGRQGEKAYFDAQTTEFLSRKERKHIYYDCYYAGMDHDEVKVLMCRRDGNVQAEDLLGKWGAQ